MPEAVRIIRVTTARARLLASIADGVFGGPVDPAETAGRLASDDVILIAAIDDGIVVGQVAGSIVRHADSAADLYIDSLGVSPEWRQRGIGRQLVDAITQTGRELGCVGVWVLSEPGNLPAQKLYARAGLGIVPVVMQAGSL